MWLRVACGALALVCADFVQPAVTLGQARALTPVGSIPGPAQRIEVDGRTLYVAADRTLRSYDMTDPTAPRPSATFTFPERISVFAVSGSRVYAMTEFFGLRVLDLSNAASPTLRGALALKGGVIAVKVLDAKTILTANMVAGVQVLDVSEPAKPALLTNHFTDGYVQDVFPSRPLVYVADDPTGLHVLDLSKPGSPAEVSITELDIPPPPGGVGLVDFPSPRLVLVERPGTTPTRVAAVLDRTGARLLFYDVSNPSAPARLSGVNVPRRSETLKAQGARVYVAGAEGLHVVDAADPQKPVAAGTHKTAQPALDLAVTGSHVFVATGSGGVVILRDTP